MSKMSLNEWLANLEDAKRFARETRGQALPGDLSYCLVGRTNYPIEETKQIEEKKEVSTPKPTPAPSVPTTPPPNSCPVPTKEEKEVDTLGQNPNSRPVLLDDKSGLYVFRCPHCDSFVEVEKNQVNCHIFRHAYFFNKLPNGQIVLTQQLNPHAPKEMCDKLVAEGKVYGCGKPFRFVRQPDGKYIAEICGYI